MWVALMPSQHIYLFLTTNTPRKYMLFATPWLLSATPHIARLPTRHQYIDTDNVWARSLSGRACGNKSDIIVHSTGTLTIPLFCT